MSILLSAVFIGVMIWASVHDIRTLLIPQVTTFVGIAVALFASAIWPADLFLESRRSGSPVLFDTELRAPVDGEQPAFLAVGFSGVALWISFELGIFPPFLYRRGFVRALRIWPRQFGRELYFLDVQTVLTAHVIGVVGVLIFWMLGGAYWRGFTTAIIGFLAGIAPLWSARFFGGMALRREAMGFGDVMLLGTVGAWMGWQALPAVCAVAIVFGFLFALPSYLPGGGFSYFAFGPPIALAAILVRFAWPHLEIRYLGIVALYIDLWKEMVLTLPVWLVLCVAALRSYRIAKKQWFH